MGVVGHLARCALVAKRLGGKITLSDICPELRELIRLAGLAVEMEGQPERGEEPLRVEEIQEEGHSGDLAP
jgi:hypothetical protein